MSDVVWAIKGGPEAIAAHIADVVCSRGPRTIALPGGGTPGPIFQALRRRSLPWGTCRISLTDERLVPTRHPASNFGLISRWFDDTPAEIAPLTEGERPLPFDLVCVGVGVHGNIASLFPNMALTADQSPDIIRVVPNPLPYDAPFERLSLNIPALAQTKDLMIVARGRARRRVIDRALTGDESLPLWHLIRRARGRTTVYWSRD